MEKDIGKIKKSENTDIVVRIDDFGGKRGLTVREYVTSDRYTGFTKAGTRIPTEKFLEFRELINSIALADLQAEKAIEKKAGSSLCSEEKAEEKEQKTLEENAGSSLRSEDKGKEAKPKRGRKKKAETSESKRTGLVKEKEEAKKETVEETEAETKKEEKETEEVEEF